MKIDSRFRRLLLLFVLLASGVAVIHHLVQNVIPQITSYAAQKREPSLTAKDVSQPAPVTTIPAVRPPEVKEPPVSHTAAATSAPAAARPPAVSPQIEVTALTRPDLSSDSQKTVLVTTSRGRMIATGPILFNSGVAEIRSSSLTTLNMLAEFLQSMPEVHLEIQGHTDNLGEELVNERVSSERAAAVLAYLSSRGVDPERLKSRGMGSRSPIASNENQLGRQANRRIEFHVIRP